MEWEEWKLTPSFWTLVTGKMALPFTVTGNAGERVFQDDYESSIDHIDLEVPAGRQFVQQSAAKLTSWFKGNITARERKSGKLVGVWMRISLPAYNNNNKKSKKKKRKEAWIWKGFFFTHLRDVWRQEAQGWRCSSAWSSENHVLFIFPCHLS